MTGDTTLITGSSQVTFRAGPVAEDLAGRIDGGRPTGAVARDDLERYYDLLARELLGLTFSEAEASLICDANNGTYWDVHSLPLLWANVADGIRLNDLDAKWQVDGPTLVAKLQALTPGQGLAVIDAAERFWIDTTVPTGEQLRRVGLVRDVPA